MGKKAKKPVSEMNEQELAVHEAIKGKKLRRKAEKQARLQQVLQFAIENGDEAIAKLAKEFLPRDMGGVKPVYVGGARQNLIVAALKSLFVSGNTATEDDAWTKLRLDRSSMRKKCVLAIKKAKPEERLWVSFNSTTGLYTLEGEGPNPPEGWLGYVPVDVDA